ncbi:MAG: hypothetical protein HY447_01310 [Candidatus Omnitrophica bacterium]|nr:hypothetical protein [Candidatus Omnitrophota bacterium]
MKTDGVVFVILLVLLSFAFPNQGWPQVLETAAQHLKQAESYRELAEWQREDIAGYKRERENFTKRSRPSASPQLKESIKEYDDLISEEEALLADFKILEEWHRTRAKELEGIKTVRIEP